MIPLEVQKNFMIDIRQKSMYPAFKLCSDAKENVLLAEFGLTDFHLISAHDFFTNELLTG